METHRQAHFASGLLQPSYTASWDTIFEQMFDRPEA